MLGRRHAKSPFCRRGDFWGTFSLFVCASLLYLGACSGQQVIQSLGDSLEPDAFYMFKNNTPGCNKNSSLRIAIVTIVTADASEAHNLGTLLGAVYSYKHGYNFYVERCATNTCGTAAWSATDPYAVNWDKPNLMLKHLHSNDYVLYLDGDVFFQNFSRPLEPFILEKFADPAVSLLASTNGEIDGAEFGDQTGIVDKRAHTNTGVLLARRSNETARVLKLWGEAWRTPPCNRWAYEHSREQACLMLLWNTSEFVRSRVFVDNGLNQMVAHAWHRFNADQKRVERDFRNVLYKQVFAHAHDHPPAPPATA